LRWTWDLPSTASRSEAQTRTLEVVSLDPDGARKMAAGFAQQAQDMVTASNANPWALLGFDPIELWLRVRRFYRQSPS
jgi:hypothetical protein